MSRPEAALSVAAELGLDEVAAGELEALAALLLMPEETGLLVTTTDVGVIKVAIELLNETGAAADEVKG